MSEKSNETDEDLQISLQKKLDRTSRHSDEDAPMGNCFKYVFYKLGIQEPVVMDIGLFHPPEELEAKYFEIVNSVDVADVIGVKNKYGTYFHMAFIDEERGRKIFHRVNNGHPITETNLEALKVRYPDSEYSFVFLRKR